MRMRRAQRTSSADIRTTGIVQLDSPRPRKRARGSEDDWSPQSFENGDAIGDSREVQEAVEQVDRKVAERVKAADPQADAVKTEGDCKLTADPSQVGDKPQEKKSLRHFSRTKRLSKALKEKEVASKDHEPPSDVSAEVLGNGGVAAVDLHQLPEDMKYADDESVDTKGGSDERGAKQDCSISGRSYLDRVEECLNFLEQLGLFRQTCGWADSSQATAVDPGYVGDGALSHNCKICGRPEDISETLVCDICEETFHMACCYPKIRSPPRDDRWFCSTCTRKRKKKTAELKIFSSMHFDEKYPSNWKIDRTKTRGWDLQRMERTHVRIGPAFQAEVPDWTGKIFCEKLRGDYPGLELPRSYEDKLNEKAVAEAHNLLHRLGIAKAMPDADRENWLQCQNVLHEEGDVLPDGTLASKDIVCGKWRRAPLHIVADDGWECSCSIVWDPRHADCVVPQEVPTEEIRQRPRVRMQPSLDGKSSRACRDDKYLHCRE